MLWFSVKLYCAVIVVCHQDKNKYENCHIHGNWSTIRQRMLWPYLQIRILSVDSWQCFVILKPLSHTFVPPPFQHLVLELSSLGFLLSHLPKYQIFLIYISLLSSHDPTQSYKYHLFCLYIFQLAIGFTVALLSTVFSYTSSYSCKNIHTGWNH